MSEAWALYGQSSDQHAAANRWMLGSKELAPCLSDSLGDPRVFEKRTRTSTGSSGDIREPPKLT